MVIMVIIIIIVFKKILMRIIKGNKKIIKMKIDKYLLKILPNFLLILLLLKKICLINLLI